MTYITINCQLSIAGHVSKEGHFSKKGHTVNLMDILGNKRSYQASHSRPTFSFPWSIFIDFGKFLYSLTLSVLFGKSFANAFFCEDFWKRVKTKSKASFRTFEYCSRSKTCPSLRKGSNFYSLWKKSTCILQILSNLLHSPE